MEKPDKTPDIVLTDETKKIVEAYLAKQQLRKKRLKEKNRPRLKGTIKDRWDPHTGKFVPLDE